MPPVLRDRHITVRRQSHMVKDVTQVAQAAKLGDWQIIDARSRSRPSGHGMVAGSPGGGGSRSSGRSAMSSKD